MKTLKLRAVQAATLCLAILGPIQPLQVFAQKTQPSDAEAAQIPGVSLPSLDKAIRERVNTLTLEQKVGQMTQIDLGVIAVGNPCGLQQPQTLDQEKLRIAIEKYHIGSILNVGCGSGTIGLDRWQEIHKGISTASLQYSSTQIPILFGIDAIHGVNYTVGGTLFPQQIGQAATWNPDLVLKGAEITALECRISGIPWNFSPVLDLGRQPLWSRFFETYGEDVYLAKTMTSASIRGYQGKNTDMGIDHRHVAACMKHFLGYSYPLSGKDRTPAWIPERELREYYLPTFQTAIEEGALTVMINSGELNGTPVHVNPDILTKLLREELGFKGLAVTDWEDIYKLHTTHKVAASLREAVKLAINAGIDMSMTPNDFQFNELLIDLVKSGEVPMERINEAVHRILYVKHKLGVYDVFSSAGSLREALNPNDLGSANHRAAALQTAEESITLLKNTAITSGTPTLPLATHQTLFVFGSAADDLNLLNGAWTNTWLGKDTQYRHNPLYPTIWEALLKQSGGTTTGHVANNQNKVQQLQLLAPHSRSAKLLKTLKKSLSPNAVAVFCVGETPGTEIPGNIDDLAAEIDPNDKQLFDFFVQNQVPVVLVLVTGRPRIITEYANQSAAVLQAYLPGNEGGIAIANILIGKTNPSGKLPYTYPRFAGDVVHYDHKSTERNDKLFGSNAYQPLFDFGHGLSYTQFEYSKMKVEMESIMTLPTESIIPDTSTVKKLQKQEQYRLNQMRSTGFNIELTITNTGSKPGKEVCQLYYRDEFASITPSVKKLCAYSKTRLLQPGESETMSMYVSYHDLSFINKGLQRVTEPGDITFLLKDQTTTVQIK
ncbi:MAG: beta-glucosidase [Flavobacteriales bacterium]|nr:MAG: beta-glucosidase [Flavobacteriales bacterium]